MDAGFSGIEATVVKRMVRLHGSWVSKPYHGSYSDEEIAIVASLDPHIVAFDNTDTLEYEFDLSDLGDFMGKRAFPPDIMMREPKVLLPSAVSDAKRLKQIFE